MKQPSPDALNRSFGYVMAGGFGALAVLRYAMTGRLTWWLGGLVVAFLVCALVVPGLLSPLRVAWMKLASVLGFINQRILLTIVFALLVTPTALLMTVLGKRPIALQADPSARSYWRKRRPEEFTASRLERQF